MLVFLAALVILSQRSGGTRRGLVGDRGRCCARRMEEDRLVLLMEEIMRRVQWRSSSPSAVAQRGRRVEQRFCAEGRARN